MAHIWTEVTGKFDFGGARGPQTWGFRRGLRLAVPSTGPALRGPDKYRVLDLRRRRAQIRARKALDLESALQRT